MSVLLESVTVDPEQTSIRYVVRCADGKRVEGLSLISNTRGIRGLSDTEEFMAGIGHPLLDRYLLDALFAVLQGTPPAFPYDLEAASLIWPPRRLSR